MANVIYDYETLGTDSRFNPVLSLAILRYDPERFTSDNPYTFKELCEATKEYKFDVRDQVENLGRKIDKDTLDWWKKQPQELQDSQLKPSPHDLPISKLYDCMAPHCKNVKHVFTRGNTFDPMFTEFLLWDMGQIEPYHWSNVRDTRSFIEGLSYGTDLSNKFIPPGLEDVFVEHDPIHDVAIDVMRMQTIIRELS